MVSCRPLVPGPGSPGARSGRNAVLGQPGRHGGQGATGVDGGAGRGAIGVELAQVFARFQCAVTVVPGAKFGCCRRRNPKQERWPRK
ncbi:NAD-binding protein [Streptomyces sp. NPDC059862]|uniref:NAD-binding protein n=1 Tax=Streptomyces sp. NPDC059862 TaxID=3346975 RepID=UPI003650AD0B